MKFKQRFGVEYRWHFGTYSGKMREVRKSLVVVSWGKVSKGETPSSTGFWLLAASDFLLAGPILASEIEHKEGKNGLVKSERPGGKALTEVDSYWGLLLPRFLHVGGQGPRMLSISY
jgi:hypothetical protein